MKPVYVASRASIPERSEMWRKLRDECGWKITSSWIDEAGEGDIDSFEDLWARIEREIHCSDALILYAERDDFPLKGAYVEAGMAIALVKPVIIVLGGGNFLEPRSMKPLGSWAHHPTCHFKPSLVDAYAWVNQS